MQTIEAIKKKIEVTNDLHSIVKTMKTLAAVSIRQYENTVTSIGEYHRTIEMGLQIVLKNMPGVWHDQKSSDNQRVGIIIFGSDQGLCGQFNERIASYFLETMQQNHILQESRRVLAVGTRVAGRIEGLGQPVEDCFSAPGSLSGFVPLVHKLLLKMESWQTVEKLEQFHLFYNQPLSKASFLPNGFRLLPLAKDWFECLAKKTWPTNNIPMFTLDSQKLFSSLIRQYVSVRLFRALAESLMSENASRLAAMQVAEKNIEDRLEELTAQFQHERQSSITEELLDIMSGFEALTGGSKTENKPSQGH